MNQAIKVKDLLDFEVEIIGHCGHCGKPLTKKGSGGRVAKYCNSTCRVAAWRANQRRIDHDQQK